MNVYKGNKILFDKAEFANDFGLMFQKRLKNNEAIIMAINKESRFFSSLHMIFVFFPIYAVWLNKDKKIIDIKKLYPFQPFSMPRKPGFYVLECCNLPDISINDQLSFL